MKCQKIKITLITGFLGSGKTTLLNLFLEQQNSKLNYVIENEFGNTSIDGALVNKNYKQLFELNNGCICCSLDTELIAVLEQMIKDKNRPENLFIEASGVADAGMLASIFKREDVMDYFDLQSIIAIVDAESFEDRILEVPEISRQLVAADFILINKADRVQESYIRSLERQLLSINPFAKIINCEFGQVDAEFFNDKIKIPKHQGLDLISNKTKVGHGMKSIAIPVPISFDREKLYAALSVTMYLHYHQIYRIKGFVNFEGSDDYILVQSTGNKLNFTKHEFQAGEQPQPILVFIGKNIERPGLERILRNLYTPIETHH